MSYLDPISFRQQSRLARWGLWVVLILGSAVPRVLAAFLLPNEEGDPYSYLQSIQIMRASLVGGTFTISELFGFWLPLYQFICALISAVVGNPLYVAKLVSAVCGTGVCLLVFWVSFRLTASRMLSLLPFGLIALNPVHIMYSAFSMSDVPHAVLVLSSLCFAIRQRWVLAAVLVAAGGLMRPESWVFIALLPALQWLLQRRVSLWVFLIALSSPLVWIYISWSATGNPLEYFKVRSAYITELVSGAPGLAHFSPSIVFVDMRTLFYSSGPAVMIACLIAGVLLIKQTSRQADHRPSPSSSAVVIALGYFFSSLGFLLFAYFTKNQPAIFARYCLALFALGLPVLAWIFLATRGWKRALGIGLTTLLVGLCLLQFALQFRDGASFLNHVSQKRIVADYLRANAGAGPDHKIFCDDDTVKILARIPADSFVSSSGSPAESKSFLNHLLENQVEYLVYEERDGSALVSLFRDLGDDRIKDLFQLVLSTNVDLRVYRIVTSFRVEAELRTR